MTRGRTTWVVLGGVLVAVGLFAWLAIGRTKKGDTVEILGDSITAGSDKALRAGLSDFTLHVQAIGGLRTDQLEGAAQQAATSNPKQVIINLGTNDIMQKKSLAEFQTHLDRLVATFPSATCIHVVNLNTHIIDTGGVDAALTAANHAIDTIIDAHDNADKIDWDRIVTDAIEHKDAVTVDSIHPNEKGQLLLAQAYNRAVKDCGKPKI